MVQRIGGTRRKSRKTFRKNVRERGKFSLTKFFQKFDQGQNVVLKAEPSYQKALYHARLHGKLGIVTGKRGRCYEVTIKDGGVSKMLIVHPIHLKGV